MATERQRRGGIAPDRRLVPRASRIGDPTNGVHRDQGATPLSQQSIALIAIASALISAFATPAFGALARRLGMVVAPRPDRWHRSPTPLLGGAAMVLAIVLPVTLTVPPTAPLLVLLGCAVAAFAFGLIDDIRRVAPATKLVGQVIIALALAFGGIRVEVIEFTPLALLVTVFWVVGIMNAVNLLDNMDGLAAGVTAIAASVLGFTALASNPVAATMAFATAAAALGFLPHNFHPARVFMGDAGSQLLGFMLAAVALIHKGGSESNAGLAVLGPVLLLALPIFDTAFVTLSRRVAGRPIGHGGRDHTSHRLAALGLSDRGAVLFLYAIAAGLALAGVVAQAISTLLPPLVVLVVVGLILFGLFLAEVDVYGRASTEDRVSEAPRDPVASAFATYGRFGAEVLMDVVLLTTAYYLAYVIRFEGADVSAWLYLFAPSVPIVVGGQLAALVVLGVYRTLWRYLTVHDAVIVGRAVAVGTAVAAIGIVLAFRFQDYSRAVLVLDALLAALLLLGSRAFLVWLRQWFATRPRAGENKVLIVGANDSGALALRLLGRAGGTQHRAIGFIDDDPGKRYRRVAGVPVVGTTEELGGVIERLRPDLVLFATNGETGARLRATCDELGVPWRELTLEV